MSAFIRVSTAPEEDGGKPREFYLAVDDIVCISARDAQRTWVTLKTPLSLADDDRYLIIQGSLDCTVQLLLKTDDVTIGR